jgi:hypothetical protein
MWWVEMVCRKRRSVLCGVSFADPNPLLYAPTLASPFGLGHRPRVSPSRLTARLLIQPGKPMPMRMPKAFMETARPVRLGDSC